ncbi:MAG: FprA family A-type flavoprotein [Bacillota bacterium]
MNQITKLNDDIYWVGVNDRETDLFEALWPLPEGISYNSYLIIDEKTALIDTVKFDYHESYLKKIESILGDKKLDYLIINHMEPDHSGDVKAIKEKYPEIKIIGNKKTLSFLEGFYNIKEGVKAINNGESINLGNRELEFYLTPMVHWPETMMTYDNKSKTLFSGDAFGSFGALDGGIFDDEIDIDKFENEIRRYYSNIVGKYSRMVQSALKKLENLEIENVASTHGPVWRKNPDYIIDFYDRLSSHQTEEGVVVVYGSMYGNTKLMAERIARTLAKNGVKNVEVYDAARTDDSFLLSEIWKYKGLIIGSCAYNTKVFPPVESLLSAIENRKLNNRFIGAFGSYSWSGGGVKGIKEYIDSSSLELIEPIIESKHAPAEDNFNKCDDLAKNMAKKIMN